MKFKKKIKILSFVFAIILTISLAMPTHTLAADQNLPDDYVSQDNTSDVEAPTVYKEAKDPAIFQQELDELAYEIVSLREKNVKHFRLADGNCWTKLSRENIQCKHTNNNYFCYSYSESFIR